jgi:hypothetical protein
VESAAEGEETDFPVFFVLSAWEGCGAACTGWCMMLAGCRLRGYLPSDVWVESARRGCAALPSLRPLKACLRPPPLSFCEQTRCAAASSCACDGAARRCRWATGSAAPPPSLASPSGALRAPPAGRDPRPAGPGHAAPGRCCFSAGNLPQLSPSRAALLRPLGAGARHRAQASATSARRLRDLLSVLSSRPQRA